MKLQVLFLVMIVLAAAGFAEAQRVNLASDILGAHLNYGRGCTACHSPHSGAYGNGTEKTTDEATGNVALWGEDVSGLYGKTISTDGGKYAEVLPASMSSSRPDAAGMLTCLSCHDGNYAHNAMMKNKLYEPVPSTYGNSPIPTLLGASESNAGNHMSEHPMGLKATIGCGGPTSWDCTQSNGVISMNGSNSSRFVNDYGFFVRPGNYNNTAVIVCTTCHDPHVMNVVVINSNSDSGLPAGAYTTMFFLRAPYSPNDMNSQSNQTSQFCRQCHADKSNEAYGGSAGTVF
jgi:hypothetical protein